MKEVIQELESFIQSWPDSPEQNKKAFVRLKDHLVSKPGIKLKFLPRPKVTYSLRATHENLGNRPLFAMVDVIEDQPRWLSVCFYAEMIKDPEERGDFVPGGLLGEDAICFDLDEFDEDSICYIEARLDEAYQSAVQG